MARVTDITFDPMGNLYAADRDNNRTQLFMTGQSKGMKIAGVAGAAVENATLFKAPCDVTDANNHRIQILFSLLNTNINA